MFQTLGKQYRWQSLHRHGNQLCPCTCLGVRDKVIVTAGEDGRLVVLNADQKSPQRIIGNTVNSFIIALRVIGNTVNSFIIALRVIGNTVNSFIIAFRVLL